MSDDAWPCGTCGKPAGIACREHYVTDLAAERARVAELEAQCGAMREALERCQRFLAWARVEDNTCGAYIGGHCGSPFDCAEKRIRCPLPPLGPAVAAALSGDAGRTFLAAKRERDEAAARVARMTDDAMLRAAAGLPTDGEKTLMALLERNRASLAVADQLARYLADVAEDDGLELTALVAQYLRTRES